MPKSDLHAIDGIDSWIAGWSAAQGRNACFGNKAHMHQVVLNGFREVEVYNNPSLTNPQLTENAHPPDSDGSPKRQDP